MSDLQLFFYGLSGMFSYFWPVLIVFIALLIRLWRWELEQERMEQSIKRDNLKREYHQEHSTSRY